MTSTAMTEQVAAATRDQAPETTDERPRDGRIIQPTVGGIVWFHPHPATRSPVLAAMITAVHNDRLVNLRVWTQESAPSTETSVVLRQPDDGEPVGQAYCQWMPYQVHQAARTEQLDSELRWRISHMDAKMLGLKQLLEDTTRKARAANDLRAQADVAVAIVISQHADDESREGAWKMLEKYLAPPPLQ